MRLGDLAFHLLKALTAGVLSPAMSALPYNPSRFRISIKVSIPLHIALNSRREMAHSSSIVNFDERKYHGVPRVPLSFVIHHPYPSLVAASVTIKYQLLLSVGFDQLQRLANGNSSVFSRFMSINADLFISSPRGLLAYVPLGFTYYPVYSLTLGTRTWKEYRNTSIYIESKYLTISIYLPWCSSRPVEFCDPSSVSPPRGSIRDD